MIGLRGRPVACVGRDLHPLNFRKLEDLLEQVSGAEWAVDESVDQAAAVLDRGRNRSAAVDGNVDQKARLRRFAVQLLHQAHAGRRRRGGGVTRVLHGRAAIRLRRHVVSHRALVPVVLRLEVHDRFDSFIGTFRPEPIRRHVPADAGCDRLALVRRDQSREPDPLNSRVAPADFEPLDVGTKLNEGDVIAGGKQTRATVQHRDVRVDPVVHCDRQTIGQRFEPCQGTVGQRHVRVGPRGRGEQERDRQNAVRNQ